MLYGLVTLIGIFIALMIAFNGALGGYLSAFEVSFIVHVIGLVILMVVMAFKKEKIRFFGIPKWFYLTGILGACLTAIDAYVVGAIGVTLAVTLSTVAQIVGSAGVDAVGIGHLKKVPFNKKRAASLSLLMAGVGIMLLAQWKGW
ncbi:MULTISPECIES: DMT family transporter [unclassified Fusibacter]|uniref:DMT family transporter n=1 Tax=unclassified Fusibacter TaxID=2624464 RepID=UPI001010C81F|nr:MULTISPECIES: DMT family transporter [unclassified Fusibacter]MCK8061210.1 DMT family transporter [Fusibacter sp. A2]NPE23446.1 DMT family transporter [Fusibacter sp. A1]RXV59225.1 DMT family transporter [Fusibacter sp. A1]